ncbi:hypothetical protein QN360_01210 [Glaciimonas sp. CA11.2]|uniref:hypothetical protein n=1 Tax=unclassified Glaciimonas TaxID=2644401 RepID=UPI002AB51B00|nr:MULTISPECIES: hypothetical protein [unclassified Glaciimonas]MDY7549202.1 hypothetical protein [Glaciimonas sp. CA11.2]MEB0013934.1 hypothetical protein [Glaciimonas sp. Cout2]MEB0083131.1 hypothetical protein [Glaciimonas sp. Gout2]MEB0161523.1 hypothetical protein [Glaciimonas sp. CA11.2]
MPKWMLVTAFAIVVSVGGLVYYVFPSSPANTPGMPPQVIVQPEQKSGNPLLTATSVQFYSWFPNYCQADIFITKKETHSRKVCVVAVTKRVEESTGVRLTEGDILDPAVADHWKKTGK